MRIDALAAEVRVRPHWETLDLGLRMAQRWSGAIWTPFLALWLPFSLLVMLAFFGSPWALLVLWWVKPVFSRVPVFVLSRALFGATPSVRETLTAATSFWRQDLVKSLTIGRFSPNRVQVLPVLMLEGQRGADLKQRRRLIIAGGDGFNVLICLAFLCCEWLLLFGGGWVLFTVFLLPEEIVREGLSFTGWTLCLLYVGAVAFTEPFFSSVGFARYINRRAGLERWDLELVFRKLAARLAKAALLLLVFGAGLSLRAQEVVQVEEDPAVVIGEVLEDPVFGGKQTVKRWTPKSDWGSEASESRASDVDLSQFLGFLGPLGRFLAYVLIALLVAAFLMLVYLILKPLLQRPISFGDIIEAEASSLERSGQVKLAELAPVPDDPVTAATKAWAEGDARLALSLLYRGALVTVRERKEAPFEDHLTEEECLRIARPLLEASVFEHFRVVARAWQRLAYAHLAPDDTAFAELCDQWRAMKAAL